MLVNYVYDDGPAARAPDATQIGIFKKDAHDKSECGRKEIVGCFQIHHFTDSQVETASADESTDEPARRVRTKIEQHVEKCFFCKKHRRHITCKQGALCRP